MSVAAIWLIVFIADWAAFRVMATFEALLPATTLFVFSAALGGSGSPITQVRRCSDDAALLFVLLQRTSNQERTSRWASEHRAQGRWSLLGTGGALIGLAVIGGTIAGPQLPGADEDALLAWRDLTKDTPTRVVRSPMVQLQTRQVDQTNVELFTVNSPEPSYWRLTSLETFDGDIWKSAYSTDDANGELPALDPAGGARTVHQTFNITQLRSVWLPAAFEPRAIDTGDDEQPADFDERSSTLLVDRRVDYVRRLLLRRGLGHPALDGRELQAASRDPERHRRRLPRAAVQLPPAGDGRGAEGHRRRQHPLRQGPTAAGLLPRPDQFTYDLNVGPGHSNRALETFLFGGGRGYCEQFAGAFAAMARSVGLPAGSGRVHPGHP